MYDVLVPGTSDAHSQSANALRLRVEGTVRVTGTAESLPVFLCTDVLTDTLCYDLQSRIFESYLNIVIGYIKIHSDEKGTFQYLQSVGCRRNNLLLKDSFLRNKPKRRPTLLCADTFLHVLGLIFRLAKHICPRKIQKIRAEIPLRFHAGFRCVLRADEEYSLSLSPHGDAEVLNQS